MKKKKELDIDETHKITDIRYLLYDEEEENFYIMCNRKEG